MLYASIMAEGLGFEPSHNGFRDRRATATLALNMYGRGRGIRTLTERILSPVPLPLGYAPIKAYWGQGATPGYATHYQFKVFHGILPFSDTHLPTLGISSSTD